MNTKELEVYIKNHPNRPVHIGIIMDGNGRWAQRKGLPRIAGHNRGIDSVHEVVEVCGELGVKVLTLYTFSIENWKRPRWEVSALMELMVNTVRREIQELEEKNVKHITRISDGGHAWKNWRIYLNEFAQMLFK